MNDEPRIYELGKFLESKVIGNPFDSKKIKSSYTLFDRDFHALLLWGLELDLYSDRVFSDAELHLKESIADISTANLCSLMGTQKPAMMLIRSAIENFVKYSIVKNGGKIDDTTSVYILNDRFMEFGKNEKPHIRKLWVFLISQYSDLCKHVHSAGREFMDMAIFYNETFSKNEKLMIDRNTRLNNVVRSMAALIYRFEKVPTRIHHRQRDYILDRLPRTIKLELSEE